MQKYTFGIYSLEVIKHLDITIDIDDINLDNCTIVSDLKAILTGDSQMPEGSVIICQVGHSHETNLNKFVELYKDVNIPQIKALPSLFLKKIGMNNFYAISLNKDLKTEDVMTLIARIESLQNRVPFEDLMKHNTELFDKLLANYNIYANNGEGKIEIGTKEKDKRICRYCHKDNSNTTFNKVAHTISEAFGNKGIITNDECDTCNEYFGNNVEPALIEYLNFFRVFYGVQGKKGKIHHIFGDNYDMEKKDDKNIKLDVKLTDDEIKALSIDNPEPLLLKSHKEVVEQDIYRTLVKYALGILQPEMMKEFNNTVEWLLGKREVENLPLVRMEISPRFIKQPFVVVMLRKSEDTFLPYAVSELQIMNVRFLFPIPLCDDRDKPFLGENYWSHFLEVFKMYKVTAWQKHDFSCREKKQLTMKINFEEKGKE